MIKSKNCALILLIMKFVVVSTYKDDFFSGVFAFIYKNGMFYFHNKRDEIRDR